MARSHGRLAPAGKSLIGVGGVCAVMVGACVMVWSPGASNRARTGAKKVGGRTEWCHTRKSHSAFWRKLQAQLTRQRSSGGAAAATLKKNMTQFHKRTATIELNGSLYNSLDRALRKQTKQKRSRRKNHRFARVIIMKPYVINKSRLRKQWREQHLVKGCSLLFR